MNHFILSIDQAPDPTRPVHSQNGIGSIEDGLENHIEAKKIILATIFTDLAFS